MSRSTVSLSNCHFSNSFEVVDGSRSGQIDQVSKVVVGTSAVVESCASLLVPISARLLQDEKTPTYEYEKQTTFTSPTPAEVPTPRPEPEPQFSTTSLGNAAFGTNSTFDTGGLSRGDNPSLDTGLLTHDDVEMSTSSESYENWSFVTNASNAGFTGDEKIFDLEGSNSGSGSGATGGSGSATEGEFAEDTMGGQDFHSAAELAEFVHITDTIATYDNIRPLHGKDELLSSANALKSPPVYSIQYNSVSYASALSNGSDFQSLYDSVRYDNSNDKSSHAVYTVESGASNSERGLPQSTTTCQVHERIAPSPIEMFRSSCLLPNKRFRFHIVYSVMANLRYDAIKILPRVSSKRKVLVPWIVTECISPKLEASIDDSKEVETFKTPEHTPNARLELDAAEIKEQYYVIDPKAVPVTVTANRTLTTLDHEHYAEIARIVGNAGTSRAVFNKAQHCVSVERFLQANATLQSLDLDSASNHTQTSKQVLVGSLNRDMDAGISSVSGFDSTSKEKNSSDDNQNNATEGGESSSFSVDVTRRTRVSTMVPESHYSHYETASRTDTQKRKSSRRFFSLLRKKDRKTPSRKRRSVDIEAFGDRLGSPTANEQSSRRGSFFSRFSRSGSRSRYSTLTFKETGVDDMVQNLYNKFQNDTEFHMMIMNFRCRAKLKKPKHGTATDMQRDLKLSCSNATSLFSEFYPQLRGMKNKKQQKEVVNKVLGRSSRSKESVNEIVLVDAFRPTTCL